MCGLSPVHISLCNPPRMTPAGGPYIHCVHISLCNPPLVCPQQGGPYFHSVWERSDALEDDVMVVGVTCPVFLNFASFFSRVLRMYMTLLTNSCRQIEGGDVRAEGMFARDERGDPP